MQEEQVTVGSKSWFDKLERKIDNLCEKMVRLETVVEMLIPRQDALEKEIDSVKNEMVVIRSDVTELKAENTVKHKNVNIWLGIGMVATAIIAVIVGVLLDHYILK